VARLARLKVSLKDSNATPSLAAVAHGKLRQTQSYSAASLIHDSRILQVTSCETVHESFSVLDFTLLLPDVMIIADEVDSQLTQKMEDGKLHEEHG
jgi:hypothetical protein